MEIIIDEEIIIDTDKSIDEQTEKAQEYINAITSNTNLLISEETEQAGVMPRVINQVYSNNVINVTLIYNYANSHESKKCGLLSSITYNYEEVQS